MYDKTLIIDQLLNVEEALLHINDRTTWIKTKDDFASTPRGVDILDVVTIRLMAVGEEVRKIDKRTKGTLLCNYTNIDWEKIIAMRNFIAHDYFRLDNEIIFDSLKHDVPPLLSTIQQMIADLEKKLNKE